VKDLMPVEVDAATGVPYFKLAEVTIEKVYEGGEVARGLSGRAS